MKKSIKTLLLILILMTPTAGGLNAQPLPSDEHGQTDDYSPQKNGPIGSGLAILITLGATYGMLKLNQQKPRKM